MTDTPLSDDNVLYRHLPAGIDGNICRAIADEIFALEAATYGEIRETLEFYASPRSYGTRKVSYGVRYSDVDLDGGDKARALLSSIGASHE